MHHDTISLDPLHWKDYINLQSSQPNQLLIDTLWKTTIVLDITHCQHEASSSLSDSLGAGAECLRRRRKQGKSSIYFAWKQSGFIKMVF